VIGYRVYLRKSDGVTFIINFSYCDGSQTSIFEARSCAIPSTSFVSQLYGLQWGEKVYAKIIAYNIYGESVFSPLSNPTTLMYNPDPPVSLTENTSLRSFFDVTFVWQNGAENRGSPIIDY